VKCHLFVSKLEGIFLKRTEQNSKTNLVNLFSPELLTLFKLAAKRTLDGVSSFLVSARYRVIRLT
jgi:hypothetical protein